MQENQINEFLNKIENETLEFKLCENKLGNSFWETYSAFANTNGGTIVLGIEEANSKVKNIIGVNNPEKIKLDIINLSNSKSKVSYNALKNIDIVKLENKSLIIVTIKKISDANKPVYLNDNIKLSYIRSGEADQIISKELLKSMLINSYENLDSQLLPETYTIDDINIKTVERYRSLIDDELCNYSEDPSKFLFQLGAFRKDREDNNKIKLTKGALLFFGKYNSITDLLPHFQLDYFEIDRNSESRWEDRVSSGDMQYPELNIFDFYLIVYKKLGDSIKNKFILDKENKQRLPYKDNLQESMREALVNSLMHAHYDNNFPIKISLYNEYIEFSNPGIMKISVEDFFNGGNSKLVNDIIATLFRKVGISEKAGTGGKRIFDVSEKLNLRSPELSTDNNACTKLRIWKKDLISTLDVSETELKIMKYMVENMVASKKEICENLELSDYYARIGLSNLVELNHIERIGKSRATRYILSGSTPRGKEGILRNIIKMLDKK